MALLSRVAVAAVGLFLCVGMARAEGPDDSAAVSSQDGKYVDKDGNPTFNIKDGKVDFYTFSGYMRYTANCMVCHGPDGLGSSYAPALVESFGRLSYGDALATIAGGKKAVNAAQQLVMPAFGENKNVMCYIDAIYVYLRARSAGAAGRGRPPEHEPKPPAFTEAENQCMG